MTEEISASRDRMERLGLRLAVGETRARIICPGEPVPDDCTVWTAEEMANYIEMEDHERQVFLRIKLKWNGSSTFRYED